MFVVAHFHMVMAVAPILVVFGAIYHWYPEDHRAHARTTRWASSTSGSPSSAPMRSTIRCTTSASWACRAATTRSRDTNFIPESAQSLNVAITIAALVVGAAQILFLYNLIWSYFNGQAVGRQSVERHDAGMADAGHAAEARQLRPGAAGGLSLGLRLQRAGRRSEDFIPQNVAAGRGRRRQLGEVALGGRP